MLHVFVILKVWVFVISPKSSRIYAGAILFTIINSLIRFVAKIRMFAKKLECYASAQVVDQKTA